MHIYTPKFLTAVTLEKATILFNRKVSSCSIISIFHCELFNFGDVCTDYTVCIPIYIYIRKDIYI